MKSKVIQFFQNLPKEKYEQFNQAFELYRNSEGKSHGVEKAINASGFSEGALSNLLYDLQKLHEISDVEKVAILKTVQVKQKSEDEAGIWDLLNQDIVQVFKSLLAMNEEQRNQWGIDRMKLFNDVELLLELSKEAKLTDVSDCLVKVWDYLGTHIDAAPEMAAAKTELDLEAQSAKVESETIVPLAKIDVQSIRVEFPFLKEKSCPDEFKILIADKITAWNEYLDLHEKLLAIDSGDLVTDAKSLADLSGKAIAAFEENQRIYDELVCYAESGTVLGLHPIFKRLQITREVDGMSADELVKYKGSSAKYFTVNKAALAKAEKAKDEAKISEVKLRVAEREQKLALVNKKLGINPK